MTVATRRAGLGALAATLAALCLFAPGAQAAKHKSAKKKPKAGPTYAHAGRFITDNQGRVVTLHGVNMVNKLATLGYTPSTVGFSDDDAQFLADNGFNLVRLGIIWKGLEPAPGVYDELYLGGIEQTYEMLHRHGISVLLDFHQDMYNERFQGEGAPDWAIVGPAAGESASPRGGFPNNYVLQDALNHAYDAFWNNTVVPGTGRGVQDFYAAAWAHVAERFRGKPGIVGYNLFNEPWQGSAFRQCVLGGRETTPSSCGVPEFEASLLTAFHGRVTQAIRRQDAETMVFPAPTVSFDSGTVTGVGKVDDREGFAFNAYCGQLGGLDLLYRFIRGKSCAETAGLTVQNALDESARNGDALLMTEFGATDNLGEFSDYLRVANENLISWTYWAYCGCSDPTTAAKPPDAQALVVNPGDSPTGSNVKTDKLFLLAQPYASSVAGTPGPSAFDPASRTFSFRFTRRGITGKKFKSGSVTELEIPRIQYPAGYRVRVRGARVKSKSNASLLRLELCGGASKVSATVTPGRTPSAEKRCPS